MAVVKRGRRTAYDNIAAGSVAGFEHTIAGDTVTYLEAPGGGFRTSTSNAEAWHSNIAAGVSVSALAASFFDDVLNEPRPLGVAFRWIHWKSPVQEEKPPACTPMAFWRQPKCPFRLSFETKGRSWEEQEENKQRKGKMSNE